MRASWLLALALGVGGVAWAQDGEAPKQSDITFSIEGFYRARGYVFGGLFDGVDGPAKYVDHRMRLTPTAAYKDLAKLKMTVDALDNVVWGDNASLASTSLFAGGPSVTDTSGQEIPSLRLERAWVEMTLPVGRLDVGRQPSNWGMGLLANDGNGFDDSFGENRGGSTVDRAIFATRPIAIGQAIAGKDDSNIPLFAAVGVDRLVEQPLIRYYGYTCTPGITSDEPGFDARCDSNGDGVTDLSHDYTDDTRTESQRAADWWAPSNDDVFEMIYALIYDGKGIPLFGEKSEATLGTYIVDRRQRQSDSKVLVVDVYGKLRTHGIYVEGEALHIGGHTRAITLPGAVNQGTDDPLYKTADIWGYVVRGGYELPWMQAVLEHGYASGDANVADGRFTGRPLHPDYNVGLILYEQVLARVTAALWTHAAEGLWSQGGVYNSRYLFPTLHFEPLQSKKYGHTEIIAAFLEAWPDKPDGSIIHCKPGDKVDCALYNASHAPIGWEADLAIKHRWHEHLLFSLEGGFAHVTDRIPLGAAGLNPNGNTWTVQSRAGFEF